MFVHLLVCVTFGFHVVSVVSSANCPKYAEQLLLVSMDGFRWDYTHGVATPNFDLMAQEGVTVDYVNNTFITKTFPSHYSIITGLYEETHGIVGNTFYDPVFNQTFTMRSHEPKWWSGGEPLWVTARKSGKKSGTIFWPGSDVEIRGYRPNSYLDYDESMPFDERIERAMNLLHDDKENFVTVYFHEPDKTGHLYGPDSIEVKNKVVEMDKIVGKIRKRIADKNLNVNLIITSDHGMTGIDLQNKLVDISSLIDLNAVIRTSDKGPCMHLTPKEGQEDALIANLSNHNHFTVYRKENIPEFWHYGNNRRVMPIFLAAKDGYSLTLNTTKARSEDEKGNHGYDNRLMNMRPIFYATGPNFRKNVTATSINSVDIYPLVCRLLDFNPSVNNGSLENTKEFIVPNEVETCGGCTYSPSRFGVYVMLCIAIMFMRP